MSSKFLNGSFSGDITALTNGTTSLYLKSLRINDLESNKDVLSDQNKFLTTGSGGSFVTNPYNGTLQVSDLKTDTINSLNTSITNLETKTQNIDLLNTDNIKTTFNQNLLVDEIETKQIHAKDITGLQLNGDFKTGVNKDTYIWMDGSDINIEANSDITIKTADFIILNGKVSCESDITTEKTIFTQDKELVSKLYVDTSISNIPSADITNLNTKTQNISLTETDTTRTTFNQNLIANDIITTNITHPSLSADITMNPGIVNINATNTFLNSTVELGNLMFPSIASGVDIGVETIGQFRNIFCDRLGGLSAPTNASDATTKDYVDGLITPLETRTQNQSAIVNGTTFQGEVLATTNFQVQDDPTIYGRLNNNSVLLGNTSGFSYSRFEDATLKIEAVSTSPNIPQIDFNFGFNTNTKCQFKMIKLFSAQKQ